LLISKTVVGGEQQLKTGFLGNLQKISIREGGPALLARRSDLVPSEKTLYRNRRSLIEQDAHY